MAPFEVTFDMVESFASKKQNNPFVLRGGNGLTSLVAFYQRLGLELMRVGLGKWVRPGFTPHVTMLYDQRRVPAQPTEPIGWRVTSFVLVHSLLGKTEHRRLGEWELSS